MTSFYCVHCGAVFAKGEVSEPMESAPGWVWVRDNCPRCRKGMDDWYASLNGVTRYRRVLRAAALSAVRHDRVPRKGVYVGHWRMERWTPSRSSCPTGT